MCKPRSTVILNLFCWSALTLVAMSLPVSGQEKIEDQKVFSGPQPGEKLPPLKARIIELLNDVGIPAPEQRMHEYPHQLSGGMKQRVMIATALAGEPDLLIADEPTTALDVTIQAQVLDLIRRLQKQRGMAVLLITHDLGVVAQMADRVAVMYAGQIVEQANSDEFFSHPRHPYSERLFASLPSTGKRGQRLAMIAGSVPSLRQNFTACRFVERCTHAWDLCREQAPAWHAFTHEDGMRCHLGDEQIPADDQAQTLIQDDNDVVHQSNDLSVKGLRVHFPILKGVFKHTVGHVRAVDGVDIETIGAGRRALQHCQTSAGCYPYTPASSIP